MTVATLPGGVRTAAAILADIDARGGEMEGPTPLRLNALTTLAERDPEHLMTASDVRYWTGATYNVARSWTRSGLLRVHKVQNNTRRYRAADVLCAALAATS